MWDQLWNSLTLKSDGLMTVFLPTFVVFAIKAAAKFLTKLPTILNDPPLLKEKKAAYFDTLRVGLDLAFIGFVGSFGVLGIALKHADLNRVRTIADFQFPFLGLQLLLVFITLISTAMWSSPEKAYKRGIFIPSLFGLVSIYTAIAVYSVLRG
jgi:hypothetical protein